MTVRAYLDRQLFALGRLVLLELRGSMRPSRKTMRAAAAKLDIPQSLAWKAFNRYTYDDKGETKTNG